MSMKTYGVKLVVEFGKVDVYVEVQAGNPEAAVWFAKDMVEDWTAEDILDHCELDYPEVVSIVDGQEVEELWGATAQD